MASATSLFLLLATGAATSSLSSPPPLSSRTPPMGWMSWQTFRCNTDCVTFPEDCISERLYQQQTDALVSGGFLAAGYNTIHLDDCIVAKERNATTDELMADPARFPSGFAALGDYMHNQGVSFGFYTAISDTTCGGYPASRGFEQLDANTFAKWGVDYLKADGCGDPAYYGVGYAKMGAALQASGRPMIYSCSWAAYLGNDETVKPFGSFISAGCNLWRNYLDMGPTVGYLQGIIEHFGLYSDYLAEWAGPGHNNDADMVLAGMEGVSQDAARTQLSIYAILALPLIMGNDLRAVSEESRALLLNPGMIAINQDPEGRAGMRLGGAGAADAPTQVWFRPLSGGDVAVALYNRGPPPSHPFHTPCDPFNATVGGYFSPLTPSPQGWCVEAFGQSLLEWYCCNSEDCAGYNYSAATGAGCLFKDVSGPFIPTDANTTGYTKPNFVPPVGGPALISFNFSSVGVFTGSQGSVRVVDVWEGKEVGLTNATAWSATVPWQGTVLLRLSTVPGG